MTYYIKSTNPEIKTIIAYPLPREDLDHFMEESFTRELELDPSKFDTYVDKFYGDVDVVDGFYRYPTSLVLKAVDDGIPYRHYRNNIIEDAVEEFHGELEHMIKGGYTSLGTEISVAHECFSNFVFCDENGNTKIEVFVEMDTDSTLFYYDEDSGCYVLKDYCTETDVYHKVMIPENIVKELAIHVVKH